MRRPDPTETALDALREIRLEPARFHLARDLAPFLKHRSNQVVAKAAALAVPELAQQLVEAFRRLIKDAAKFDAGCVALPTIVRKLIEIEDASAEIFFAGLRHVQREPVYGGHVDTAAPLRGMCAIALARMAHPDALLEAVNLLVDVEQEARIGAVRALAESGRADAELVLRFKALAGDGKPEVTAECFAALLRLGPGTRALPFVAEFLSKASEEVAESAAIALGESRMVDAFPLLKAAFVQERSRTIRRAILMGMALSRQDEAIEFLFERAVEDRAAVEALQLFPNDEMIRKRLDALCSRPAAHER
jgi:HEAT repeat protein